MLPNATRSYSTIFPLPCCKSADPEALAGRIGRCVWKAQRGECSSATVRNELCPLSCGTCKSCGTAAENAAAVAARSKLAQELRDREANERARKEADAASARDGCNSAERIVLFASRRTGSWLLVNRLRAHPQVLMHGELLHIQLQHGKIERGNEEGYAGRGKLPTRAVMNVRQSDPQQLLRHLQCNSEGRKAVGLKLFRDHTRPKHWEAFTSWCTVCIVLRRDNLMQQYNSLQVAKRTGRWRCMTEGGSLTSTQKCADKRLPSGVQMALGHNSSEEMEGFEAWRRNTHYWYRSVKKQLARRKNNATVIHLSYERDLAGRMGVQIDPLWKALGLKESKPRKWEWGKELEYTGQDAEKLPLKTDNSKAAMMRAICDASSNPAKCRKVMEAHPEQLVHAGVYTGGGVEEVVDVGGRHQG